MISYAEAPAPESEQLDHAKFHAWKALIYEEWKTHVGKVFAAAILRVHGSMPTDEEIAKWCKTLVTADGTHHLCWKAPDWGPGELVDMSYVIASVKPMKLYEGQKPDTMG